MYALGGSQMGGSQVSQRHNVHRQIKLDEEARDERMFETSEQQSVEQFIARLLRAVRRIEGKSKAS
jgi:hypothetical protein